MVDIASVKVADPVVVLEASFQDEEGLLLPGMVAVVDHLDACCWIGAE